MTFLERLEHEGLRRRRLLTAHLIHKTLVVYAFGDGAEDELPVVYRPVRYGNRVSFGPAIAHLPKPTFSEGRRRLLQRLQLEHAIEAVRNLYHLVDIAQCRAVVRRWRW